MTVINKMEIIILLVVLLAGIVNSRIAGTSDSTCDTTTCNLTDDNGYHWSSLVDVPAGFADNTDDVGAGVTPADSINLTDLNASGSIIFSAFANCALNTSSTGELICGSHTGGGSGSSVVRIGEPPVLYNDSTKIYGNITYLDDSYYNRSFALINNETMNKTCSWDDVVNEPEFITNTTMNKSLYVAGDNVTITGNVIAVAVSSLTTYFNSIFESVIGAWKLANMTAWYTANGWNATNTSNYLQSSSNISFDADTGRYTLNLSCVDITGSADLCDGSDASGGGGGTINNSLWENGTGYIYPNASYSLNVNLLGGNLTTNNINRTSYIEPLKYGISSDGLVIYLQLNGNLYDRSGYKSDIYFSNNSDGGGALPPDHNTGAEISYNITKFGRGIDNNHEYLISINTTYLSTNSGTISFWQKTKEVACTGENCGEYYMSSWYYPNTNNTFGIMMKGLSKTDTHACFDIRAMGVLFNPYECMFNLTKNDFIWNNWVMTYTYPNNFSLYRNGNLLYMNNTMNISTPPIQNYILTFGGDYDTIHYLNSYYDEIMVFNRSWTAEEVMVYYESNTELFSYQSIYNNDECSAGYYFYGYDSNGSLKCREDQSTAGSSVARIGANPLLYNDSTTIYGNRTELDISYYNRSFALISNSTMNKSVDWFNVVNIVGLWNATNTSNYLQSSSNVSFDSATGRFTLNISCIDITGDAGLCDGNDAGGADTSAMTECDGTTTYYDGDGGCDDLSLVYWDECEDAYGCGWWDDGGDVPANEIAESSIDFDTVCTATQKLYVSGDNLACNDDDVLTEDEVEDYIFDTDNTANLNMTTYNITDSYGVLMYWNGSCRIFPTPSGGQWSLC